MKTNDSTLNTKQAYIDFCATQRDLPIYFQPWYLDSVCIDGEWDAAIATANKQVIGVLPYFLKHKSGFQYITMPPFLKMLGPYLAPSHRVLKKQHQYYKVLIEALPRVAAFKQNFHPTCTNWLPFYWKAFQQTTYYTYQIDLTQSLTTITTQYNRNIKRNIKKAQAVVTIQSGLDPKKFYQINQQSFDRQAKRMPYSLDAFLKHDQALAQQQARKIFYAVDAQQQIHGAAYLMWDQQTAYYHLSGDDPNHRKSGAGILLIHHAIAYAQTELGCITFDFEGSVIRSIEKIRLQFGATPVPYFFIQKYYAWTYQLLEFFKLRVYDGLFKRSSVL